MDSLERKRPPSLNFLNEQPHTPGMGIQQTILSVGSHVKLNHNDILEMINTADVPPISGIKWIIPADLKLDCIRQLQMMNITGNALFPGIDGIGRGLAELVNLRWNEIGTNWPGFEEEGG